MPEPGFLFNEALAATLQAMARSWLANGRRFEQSSRRPSGRAGSVAPVVQIVRVTSATVGTHGYPCLVREWDGTTWQEPYDEAAIIHAAGGTFNEDDLIFDAHLVRSEDDGTLVYAGAIGLRVLGGTSGDISGVVKLTVSNSVLTGTAADALLTLDNASTTAAGIVTTGTQSFAGQKTFYTGSNYVQIGSDGLVYATTPGDNLAATLNGAGSLRIDGLGGGTLSNGSILITNGGVSGDVAAGYSEIYSQDKSLGIHTVRSVADGGGDAAVNLLIDDGSNLTVFALSGDTTDVAFKVGTHVGVTGTIAPGAAVNGGIVTGLGSGSYVTAGGTLTSNGIIIGGGGSAIAATAAMTDGQMLVGQTSSAPLPKTISGDATLASSGALSISTVDGGTW